MSLPAHCDTRIIGPRLTLLPYHPHHVPTYHTWLLSPTLRDQTSTPPLTLSEHQTLQQQTYTSPTHYTFILTTNSTNENNLVGDVQVKKLENEDVIEISVMIAEEGSRRKGYGVEAVVMGMAFCEKVLGWGLGFVAKVKEGNLASIGLFGGRLGWEVVRRLEWCGEVHFGGGWEERWERVWRECRVVMVGQGKELKMGEG